MIEGVLYCRANGCRKENLQNGYVPIWLNSIPTALTLTMLVIHIMAKLATSSYMYLQWSRKMKKIGGS